MYEEFTNLYKLSKTLRFGLIPQGETLKHVEASGVLEEDATRAEEAKKVKKLADAYHRAFIDKTLDGMILSGIEMYVIAYSELNTYDKAADILASCAQEMRKQVAAAFRGDPNFKDMFSGKMYSEILPEFFAGDSEALESLALFNGFTTYFGSFNKNKALMYDASDDKGGPKKGTIACRVIDENLPVFLENSRKLRMAAAHLDISTIERELDVFLQGASIREFFDSGSYSLFLTQKGIDRYNQVIGGYSEENGTKIRGLNEYINLYNQKAEKGNKLPYLTMLKKQILSERTTLSFVPDAFETDEELTECLLEFDKSIMQPVNELAALIGNIREYDLDSIYISKELVRTISNKTCGSWHFIDDLLSEKYDRDSGLSEKKRSTKAYAKKKKKDLDAIKSYSIGELDALPGVDGKASRYIIGSAGFGKTGIDFARKSLHDRFKIRARRSDRSLKRDDYGKEDIKSYLDSCTDFKNLVNSFDENAPTIDYVFYAKLSDRADYINAVTPLYNKTRNYLSGKLYKNEQIKLNFQSSVFLGGWSESQEKTKLGTILMRDGEYYLGIIAKGQGDLFARVPSAKSRDVYKKMKYSILPGANKTLPHVAFSKKGLETFKPDDDILRIYREGTFKKGKTFSLNDCHKLIDYYKDCIAKTPSWSCYNFRFSDTEKYQDISGFFHEVEDAGYSLEFVDIDKHVIDDLVSTGRLYLFKISNKDFSPQAHGKPNLFTLYWKAVFEDAGAGDVQFRLNGGAEMFYRKASIKDADIIRHKKGDVVKAKNPLTKNQKRVLDHDIIKDRRFTIDHFQLNVPITINATAPDFCFLNTDAKVAIKKAADPHVIGVSRGENSLIHITVLDSRGNVVESRSLNIIETDNGGKTDYANLLAEREAARREERESWASIEGIKQLKDGYIGQVVHVLTELMLKYDAVIAIEDLNANFKQSRQKIEKAVYQQLEEKLIRKLNFLVCKDAGPCEPGGVYRGYQMTLPFEGFEKIGLQTGFIFYVSPWKTSAIDPVTGFINLFDTRYSSVVNAARFWNCFDSITHDEAANSYRFDFDYLNFNLSDNQIKMLDGTRTKWSVIAKGERIMPVRTDKGIRYENTDVAEAINALFAEYDIGSSENLKDDICEVNDKAFHEELLKLFGIVVNLRNGSGIVSPVADLKGKFFAGPADANGSYNIARKGLMLIDRIKAASVDELTARGKDGISMAVTGNEWLKYVQKYCRRA